MYHLKPTNFVPKGTEAKAFNIMLEHEIVGEVRRRRQDWELSLGAHRKGFAMLVEVIKFLDEFKGNPRRATRSTTL